MLAQATGGTINIHGAACSSAMNSTKDAPAFGNADVTPYAANAIYYPQNSGLQDTLRMYSSNQEMFSVYCYDNGGIAHGAVGDSFTGYMWLNYTYSNLPSSSSTIQRIIIFSAKYT